MRNKNNTSHIYNINQWARQHPDLVFNDNFVNQRLYLDNDTWDILADYYKDTKPGDKVYSYFPDRIRAGWFSEHSKPSIPENRLQRALTNRRKVRQRFDTTNDRLNLEEKYRTLYEVYPEVMFNEAMDNLDAFKFGNIMDLNGLRLTVNKARSDINALRAKIATKEEQKGPALDRQWPLFIALATGFPSLVYNNDGKVNNGALLNKAYRGFKKYFMPNKEATGITGSGTAKLVDLSNGALRVTPNTELENILFNEFYETHNPSVHRAVDIKNRAPKTISDQSIPLENLSIWAGVEGDKFKAGPISIFKDSTIVFPARNVKHHLNPIVKFNISNPAVPETERLENLKNNIAINPYVTQFLNTLGSYSFYAADHYFDPNRLDNLNTLSSIKQFLDKQLLSNDLPSDSRAYYLDRLKETKDIEEHMKKMSDEEYAKNYEKASIYSNRFYLDHLFTGSKSDDASQYSYTDAKGNIKPISDWNASILDGKFILANPEGGLFINRPQDLSQEQLDTINEYLREHPSWIVRPDLGGFGLTYLNKPTLKQYTSQYNENLNMFDPNYYVVGTKNKPM